MQLTSRLSCTDRDWRMSIYGACIRPLRSCHGGFETSQMESALVQEAGTQRNRRMNEG